MQARKAAQLLDNYSTKDLDQDRSYIFEILFPENRIVVDYGDQESLVYLATFTKVPLTFWPASDTIVCSCSA